jgi:hypothetical protein
VLSSLRLEAVLGFEDMPVRGPRVRRAARHLVAAKVRGGRPAVLHGEVELLGRGVVKPGGELESVTWGRQFQTLTSR